MPDISDCFHLSLLNVRYMRWNDSAISFGVDGDHSGGQAGWDSYPSSPDDVEPFLQISHRQVQLYSAIAETFDDGAQVLLYHFNNMYTRAPLPNWWSRSFWFLTPPYGDGGGTRLGTQPINTVTEFYVTPFDLFVWDHPEETRISELEQGKVIGFGISIVDRDEPSLFTSSGSALHRLPPGGRVFERPEVYGDGVLLGPAGGLETTVESTTWGRIKATFE